MLWLLAGPGFLLAVVLLGLGRHASALVFALASAVSLLLRWRCGPLVGPALLEWSPAALRIRESMYVPPRVQTVPLNALQSVRVVGPRGDRRFRFVYADGSTLEVRPWLRGAEPGAIEFLRCHLKGITMMESDPAGFFEQVRGDF